MCVLLSFLVMWKLGGIEKFFKCILIAFKPCKFNTFSILAVSVNQRMARKYSGLCVFVLDSPPRPSLLHGQESCAKKAMRTLKEEGQAVGQKSLDRERQRGPFLSVILITRYDHSCWKSEYTGPECSNEQKHIDDRLLLSEKGSRGSLAQ